MCVPSGAGGGPGGGTYEDITALGLGLGASQSQAELGATQAASGDFSGSANYNPLDKGADDALKAGNRSHAQEFGLFSAGSPVVTSTPSAVGTNISTPGTPSAVGGTASPSDPGGDGGDAGEPGAPGRAASGRGARFSRFSAFRGARGLGPGARVDQKSLLGI